MRAMRKIDKAKNFDFSTAPDGRFSAKRTLRNSVLEREERSEKGAKKAQKLKKEKNFQKN